MMKLTALLPMKGHSERVPNKNIRVCAGKPLCLWVLETMVGTDEIEKIIINTDSLEIKRMCEKYPKVVIHNRPPELIGDNVSMNKIIDYDIQKSRSEFIIQTHATNPLLSRETIVDAIRQFREDLFDSIFSVTKWQTRLYYQDGRPLNHDPKNLIRTQDLDPILEENSNFYVFSRKSFTESGARIGVNPGTYIMSKAEAIDIDTEVDFLIAEALLKVKR